MFLFSIIFYPMTQPTNSDAAAAIDRDLDRKIADGLMRRHGSNPPAPATDSKPEPMAHWAGEIAATAPRPQPSGSRLFINGIEQPQPTGSETLLEMVGYAIAEEPWEDEAKGAVLAVARWLHAQDCGHTARLLERKASE